jgi:hypothetical protein
LSRVCRSFKWLEPDRTLPSISIGPVSEIARKIRPLEVMSMKWKLPPPARPRRWSRRLLGLPVISVRQPYAWLIVQGIKDLENRSWRTHYRGPLLIHASTNRVDLTETVFARYGARGRIRMPRPENYEVGGVIGYVEVVDCVRHSASVWKNPGGWGWILARARPLKFRRCQGAVGFFRPKWTMMTPLRKSPAKPRRKSERSLVTGGGGSGPRAQSSRLR